MDTSLDQFFYHIMLPEWFQNFDMMMLMLLICSFVKLFTCMVYQIVRTPTRCHIDLAGNTSYHFAASRTVSPRVSSYLFPGPFAPFGSRI